MNFLLFIFMAISFSNREFVMDYSFFINIFFKNGENSPPTENY
jgi:hypothetical protein